MATVTLNQVRKSYGAAAAIHGVDIDIADGEFVALVGPSGCGKSTLLRMIAGLETVTGGTISIGGRVVNDLEPKDRDVAMVFQNYALYPHMTVAENMAFSLEHRGGSRERTAERVAWAAGVLGLGALLDRYPRALSGGQRQRVAMGRAIVRDPQVFLFDEPLSNLDAKLRVVMRGEIKALHQRLRVTTVYVTHDQVEAMSLADRVVVLQGGRVEQAGAPLDLYDRPANRFVAGFIGSPSMNFLSGRLAANGLDLGGTILPLPAPPAHQGRDVVLGFRPEHLAIGEVGVSATVELVEPLGGETQLTARLGAHRVIGLFRERLSARPGDHVPLRLPHDALHLFDAATGARLT
jgi:multiple sugar transport system ATP-binding protein